MATMQDLLKARQAAVAEAKVAGAITGNKDADSIPKVDPAVVSNIALGMQGSTEFVPQQSSAPVLDNALLNKELASKAIGVYRATYLRKFFRADGSPERPVDGYFYAMNDGDALILEHFAKTGKVEKVEVTK